MSNMISFLTPDFSFKDDRGFLFQLCHAGWSQVNVSRTIAGVERGGHYHKNTREAFFIIEGALDVSLERDGQIQHHSFKAGDFFVIEPMVLHSFKFTADTVMVALYDVCVEKSDGTKDIFKKGE